METWEWEQIFTALLTIKQQERFDETLPRTVIDNLVIRCVRCNQMFNLACGSSTVDLWMIHTQDCR